MADDPLVGHRLGGYEVLSVLGRGGAGTVYRASQVRLHREVALKVLDTQNVSEQDIEAFEEEARAAAALDDPRLVRVHDIGEAGGHHYLAMELVQGGSAAARLRKDGPFPWRQAVAIALDVAQALAVAHERGFVHGDVKPANVLLTEAGGAKLADLGLVQRTGAVGRRAGSIAFIAPETLRRQPTDARSDLYSLGCTIYMMLTGKKVFERRTSREIATAHVRDPAPSIADAEVDVPTVLEDLVAAMLEKDPAARPSRAQEVVARLEDSLAATTLPARSRRSSLRRTNTRGAGPMVVHALVYAVVLGAVVALAIWLARRI